MTAIQHTSAHDPHSLAPAPGVTPPEPGGTPHRFLSDALVARGLVTQEQMDAALDASRAGQRYSEILLAERAISEDDLARTLANHHRIDHVDLDVFAVEADATALVPRATARRLGALPIAILPDGSVVVAVHDPDALTHLGELGRLVRREIRPVVASRSQVQSRIAESPPGVAPAPAPAMAATPVAPEAPPVAEAPAPFDAPPAIEPPATFAAPPAEEAPAPFDAPPAITPALFDPPAPVAAPEPPAFSAPLATTSTDTFPGSERPGEDAPATEPAAGAPDGVSPPAPALGSRLPEDGGERAADLPDPPGQTAAVGVEGPAAAVVQLEQALLAAERRAAAAEERVAAAEREARFAEERVRAAEKHAEGMSAAAHAANEALGQLAQARLVSDQAAQAAATKIETLTGELEAERAARRRLEGELQRRIADQPAPAPAPAPAPPPAPVVALHAEQPAPPRAARNPAPPPPPGPPPLRPVRALAPEPVPATERQRKARGLRRMIAALKRS